MSVSMRTKRVRPELLVVCTLEREGNAGHLAVWVAIRVGGRRL